MNHLVAWFARNRVAANMLMFCIIGIGVLVLQHTPKEILPALDADHINIITHMEGATPAQAYQQLCLPLEQALQSLQAINDIHTTASQNQCFIRLALTYDSDTQATLSRVEEIVYRTPLAESASRPIVRLDQFELMVARLTVASDGDYTALLNEAKKIQQDLHARGLQIVRLRDTLIPQIHIELTQFTLEQYQLSFAQVAKALFEHSKASPSGTLHTAQNDLSITFDSHYQSIQALENIAITQFADGGQILLKDIAHISEQFADDSTISRVDGKPSVSISAYQDAHDSSEISRIIREYMQQRPSNKNFELALLQDNSQFFIDRMQMLKSNAISGLFLVFMVLWLFLRLRLAFWVTAGIPMAFLGGFIALYLSGGSINMVSTFGLLVVLGIVTDDAVIVGENIHRHLNLGKTGLQAAIDGTNEMVLPVFIAVLTTAITFIPLAFLPGPEGRIAAQIPLIVIAVLAFSLIECFFVLPAHLSHLSLSQRHKKPGLAWIETMNQWIFTRYEKLLKKALYWRYATLLFFLSLFVISIALLNSSWLNVNFELNAESEIATASVTFAQDSNPELTQQAIAQMEHAALVLQQQLAEEYSTPQILHLRTYSSKNAHSGVIFMNLASMQERKLSGEEIMQRWQALTGDIPQASAVNYSAKIGGGTNNRLTIYLNGNDEQALQSASNALEDYLRQFKGIHQIRNTFLNQQENLVLSLKPEAAAVGFDSAQLAQQVRAAFNGITLAPIDKAGQLYQVRLQLAENERRSLWDLEHLNIALANGESIPLHLLAEIKQAFGPSHLRYSNGQRIATISAVIDPTQLNKNVLQQQIQQDFLDNIHNQFPGVSTGEVSSNKQNQLMQSRLWLGFSISILVIYVIMAALFGSYTQPLLILTAVPFGLIGALLGHAFLGVELTYLSLAGMIAVSGIVINDEIVMLHYTNARLKEGKNLLDAVTHAGIDRFLAVFLTSSTTFFGLLPIIFETSWEAQFLIPLAIAIAFGVMFSTLVTLIFLPALHLALHDSHYLLHKYKLLFLRNEKDL